MSYVAIGVEEGKINLPSVDSNEIRPRRIFAKRQTVKSGRPLAGKLFGFPGGKAEIVSHAPCTKKPNRKND